MIYIEHCTQQMQNICCFQVHMEYWYYHVLDHKAILNKNQTVEIYRVCSLNTVLEISNKNIIRKFPYI